jgi:hypothetical protein
MLLTNTGSRIGSGAKRAVSWSSVSALSVMCGIAAVVTGGGAQKKGRQLPAAPKLLKNGCF